MHHPTDMIAHTMAFVTPVVEHWLEREIAQWVHTMKDRFDDPSHHERALLPRSYISLPVPWSTSRSLLTPLWHTAASIRKSKPFANVTTKSVKHHSCQQVRSRGLATVIHRSYQPLRLHRRVSTGWLAVKLLFLIWLVNTLVAQWSISGY